MKLPSYTLFFMEELSYVLTKNLLLQCNTQARFSATLSTSLEDQMRNCLPAQNIFERLLKVFQRKRKFIG